MIGTAATWCGRLIAAGAAVILAFAAVLYSDAGEPWPPYAAIAAGWVVLFFAVDGGLTRWTDRGGSRPVVCGATRLVLAVSGAALAILSAAMAARYAMTPETVRLLDRSARRDSVIVPNSSVVRLSYYSNDRPDLPRLIFVHGTPGHAGGFADYLLDPVAGFESISVDRPGFGRSEVTASVAAFEEQARALSALLVQRQGQWPILIGHSLGGPIVARVAADYPDRVRGIVILAGSLDPELESPRWYNEVTTNAVIDLKMPDLYSASNSEIAGAPAQTRLLASVLDRIRCPVEVVHGTADTLVPVANVDFIKRAFVSSPRIGVTLIEGEGHGVHKFRGVEVRAAIAKLMTPGGK